MIPILMYHQIAEVEQDKDPFGIALTPEKFEQQMHYLHKKNYRCLHLSEAGNYWQRGLDLPKRSFVLTFDDGYRDIYTTVWSILDRFGFTATIFLVAEQVGNQSNWQGQSDSLSVPLMSWSEIRELARYGFTFGNHTLTHLRLPTLNDNQAKVEIVQSKNIIEDKLGIEINLFSYPYTASDIRIQQIVEDSGHILACGGDRGQWGLFNIWRTECFGDDSLHTFALKAKKWYQRKIWLREQSALGRSFEPILKRLRSTIRRNRCNNI